MQPEPARCLRVRPVYTTFLRLETGRQIDLRIHGDGTHEFVFLAQYNLTTLLVGLMGHVGSTVVLDKTSR